MRTTKAIFYAYLTLIVLSLAYFVALGVTHR
jgi:hypothetical protein